MDSLSRLYKIELVSPSPAPDDFTTYDLPGFLLNHQSDSIIIGLGNESKKSYFGFRILAIDRMTPKTMERYAAVKTRYSVGRRKVMV